MLEEVEPERWDDLVRELGVSDVYYSRGFVEASAPLAGGVATFLRFRDVVFPCVVRSDPVDVVTPYGYGGPVGAGFDGFWDAYSEWCGARGVLSTFVVFHPLFGNADGATGFHRTSLADTVAWPLEDPMGAMHSHHRRVVRKAQRSGLVASVSPSPSSLDGFVGVYEETMRRTDAAPFYFFGQEYWDSLLAGVPLVRVDVRDDDGELLSSVLGMGEPPWLHYHLGGTTADGMKRGASHLALYSLAVWGHENGYSLLHLGGGVGGRDDSLREWKRRFAPSGLVGAAIGKAVHDEAAYLRRAGADAIDWDGFFPAYRAPR